MCFWSFIVLKWLNVDWLSYNEPTLHTSINPTWSWYIIFFYILLGFVCQYFVEDSCICIHTGYLGCVCVCACVCVMSLSDIGIREILAWLCLLCGEETCGMKDEALLDLSLVRIRGRNLGYISVDLGGEIIKRVHSQFPTPVLSAWYWIMLFVNYVQILYIWICYLFSVLTFMKLVCVNQL